ncbi:hypothetical protein BH23THE1_BH23THE1_35090 [soil metagenome]
MGSTSYQRRDLWIQTAQEEQELIKRGYVLHIPIEKKKKGKGEDKEEVKVTPFRKKYSAKRWVVERTNSWHTGSGICLPAMRKKQTTILDWYSYPVA